MLSARKSGLVLFAIFGSIALAICYGAYRATFAGWHIPGIEALAIPGAFALGGVVQAITGVRFSTISTRWSSLAGWQRGVIGAFITVLSFAFAIGCMVLVGKFNGWV